MVKTRFEGRAWLLTDTEGALVEDIDTDMIFHNAHLAITELPEMGQHALGNLTGWEHFAAEAQLGDIVLAGRNFGAGSSRQQAVDCFRSLGISCLVCRSYGAIYRRNAINAGFPLLVWEELDRKRIRHLDRVAVDMIEGVIAAGGEIIGRLGTVSQVQMDIYQVGNLFEYAKSRSTAPEEV